MRESSVQCHVKGLQPPACKKTGNKKGGCWSLQYTAAVQVSGRLKGGSHSKTKRCLCSRKAIYLWKTSCGKKACASLRDQNVPFKNHMRYLHMFTALRNISFPTNGPKTIWTLHTGLLIFLINIWLWQKEEVHQSSKNGMIFKGADFHFLHCQTQFTVVSIIMGSSHFLCDCTSSKTPHQQLTRALQKPQRDRLVHWSNTLRLWHVFLYSLVRHG